jgi:hypothetical protein
MRHAALGTPTILPLTLEYAAAVVSSLFMMAFGFVAFNRIEQDARVKGSIATS